MNPSAVLRQYFGHTAFRPGQERLVTGILAGHDALGIMPTGGGKSICYQVPAMLLPGLTLVISPLISLMKDQVAALTAAGVDAAFLNSSQDLEESRTVWSALRRRKLRLLYVAPERLENPRFLELMSGLDIPLVAVDEAHCISQWGQDFRPSYLRIAAFVAGLPQRPVLAAFTATATAKVQEDIIEQLGLRDPVRVVTGFDRPNLFFDVRKPKNKLTSLMSLLSERRGKSGIVYCATRAGVERVCQGLLDFGIPATRYHAGLSEEERRKNQDDFRFDRRTVMVATNAFGMGIDKSNVSFVVHYNMPKDLESYYQEAGRAGRDGEPADCILLYGAGDVVTAKMLIENGGQNEEIREDLQRRDLDRLDVMVGYCKTTGCLRGYLLDYFGQPHGDTCGNCGNCQGIFTEMDVTTQAQMILSCIKRMRDKLGYYVGASLVMQVLRGGHGQRIRDLGLDTLPTYGLMSESPREQVQALFDCLESKGYVFTEQAYSTLRLTKQAGDVLFRGERVTMLMKEKPPADEVGGSRKKREQFRQQAPVDGGLMAALKVERYRLAQKEGVPAYIIFSNAALSDMAARTPHSMEEFLEVSGVGEKKAAKYGEDFLSVIAAYEASEAEG